MGNDDLHVQASDDVPKAVLEAFASEVSSGLHVQVKRSTVVQLSAEAPSWVQLLGDALHWITPLKAAATVFLAQLAKNAADDVWKNKSNLLRLLKDSAVEPLQRVFGALARLKRALSARTEIGLGLPLPDDYLGVVVVLDTDDEARIAWTIAQFILRADRIQAVIQNEVDSGREIEAPVRLAVQPNGSILMRWTTLDPEEENTETIE